MQVDPIPTELSGKPAELRMHLKTTAPPTCLKPAATGWKLRGYAPFPSPGVKMREDHNWKRQNLYLYLTEKTS